jgi:limonene-1,2-epoxide hydrolase
MHIDRRTMLAGTVAVAAAGAASGTRTVWAFDRNMTGATMTEQTNPLQTVLAYHEAWSNHDMDRAMRYIAENIRCDAPAGRIEGAEAYRAFMGPFVKMLKSTKLLAAFGDDATAMIMYDTQTALVESGPGAEWLTIKNGKIVYSRFIFDRLPFEEARRKAQR